VYPIAIAKEPLPGTLNKGLIIGSKKVPKKCTTPNCKRSSEPMKKGSREGVIVKSQRFIPPLAASNASLGKSIKDSTIKIKKEIKIFKKVFFKIYPHLVLVSLLYYLESPLKMNGGEFKVLLKDV
jgi:hypothetical protein